MMAPEMRVQMHEDVEAVLYQIDHVMPFVLLIFSFRLRARTCEGKGKSGPCPPLVFLDASSVLQGALYGEGVDVDNIAAYGNA